MVAFLRARACIGGRRSAPQSEDHNHWRPLRRPSVEVVRDHDPKINSDKPTHDRQDHDRQDHDRLEDKPTTFEPDTDFGTDDLSEVEDVCKTDSELLLASPGSGPKRRSLSWPRRQRAVQPCPPVDGRPLSFDAGERQRTQPVKQSFHKATLRAVTKAGPRRLAKAARVVGARRLARPSTLFGFDVRDHPGVSGKFALTIDDAPCRPGGEHMLEELRQMLRRHDARATFFLMTDSVPGHEEALTQLLREHHEIANHCCEDRPYVRDCAEDFESYLLRAEDCCERLRQAAGVQAPSRRLFRAPHAAVSDVMDEMLERHGFLNVLCDCYANDPWIKDANFIAENLLRQVQSGSVLVIHAPEHGFREWNLPALEKFLSGLHERGLQPVTVSELQQSAARDQQVGNASCPGTLLKHGVKLPPPQLSKRSSSSVP